MRCDDVRVGRHQVCWPLLFWIHGASCESETAFSPTATWVLQSKMCACEHQEVHQWRTRQRGPHMPLTCWLGIINYTIIWQICLCRTQSEHDPDETLALNKKDQYTVTNLQWLISAPKLAVGRDTESLTHNKHHAYGWTEFDLVQASLFRDFPLWCWSHISKDALTRIHTVDKTS